MSRKGGNVSVSNFIANQLIEEMEQPLLPSLERMMFNYKLIVTRSAYQHFNDIVNKIGSSDEKKRAIEIGNQVRIFEQVDWEKELNCPLFSFLPNRLETLPHSNTLKAFSLEVFGLGDTIPCMVTATSNQGVVRAVKEQNIYLRILLHPPRSLLTNKHEL